MIDVRTPYANIPRTQFPKAAVTSIRVVAGAGNDRVITSGNVSLPLTIEGGDGNDVLYGGSGENTISGGAGRDRIIGRNGNDFLDGGQGNDRIYARGGDDLVVGGDGNDLIFLGRGSDVAIGGLGRDRIYGRDGSDIIVSGRTIYDDDRDSLGRIFQQWTLDASYQDRVDAISQGTGTLLNGVRLVENETVFRDRVRDYILGGMDQDWLLTSPQDKVRE